MTKKVWFRDPYIYIREIADSGANRVVWKRGTVVEKKTPIHRHACTYFRGDFELMAIGEQGMALLDRDHDFGHPKAVYPVWSYGVHKIQALEWLMSENRAAELRSRVFDYGTARPDELPILGQDHVVAVNMMPGAREVLEVKFWRQLDQLQEEYPDCELHIHGANSYVKLFGSNLRSFDLYPRTQASCGLMTPVGKPWGKNQMHNARGWVESFGFTMKDMGEPRNRCIFGILGALWAAEHWNEKAVPRSKQNQVYTEEEIQILLNGGVPPKSYVSAQQGRFRGKAKKLVGDGLLCGACSKSPRCYDYREGSICIVDGTDAARLAKMFNSRDSGKILDALGEMIEHNLDRFSEGREREERDEVLDPQVTKIGDQIFKGGTALAKLRDPSLRSAAVAINIGGTQGTLQPEQTPQALASGAVSALEAGGVPRDQITTEMVQKVMMASGNATDIELIIAAEAAKYALPSFDNGVVELDG